MGARARAPRRKHLRAPCCPRPCPLPPCCPLQVLEDNLSEFASMCDADEVVLFEKSTFLVISNSTRKAHGDVHRFEKVSNIVKQFKLSCM